MQHLGDSAGARRCALCQAHVSAAEVKHRCDHDLCGECFAGDLRRLEAPLHVQSLRLSFTRQVPGDGPRPEELAVVAARVPFALPLRVSFSREDLFDKLGKLFRPELQVGERLFDDAIFIRTDNPKLAGWLLIGNTPLQALIQELVAQTGPLTLEGNAVRLSTRLSRDDRGVEGELRRDVALLAQHLARLALRTHAGAQKVGPLLAGAQEASPLLDKDFLEGEGVQRVTAATLHGHRADLGLLVSRLDALPDPEPTRLSLERLHLTSGDLEPLGRLGLVALRFDSIPEVTALTTLPRLPQLGSLTLRRTGVVDLGPLTTLPGLHSLDVSRSPVTDLEPVGQMPNLERLNLRGTPVRDLTPLASCESLRRLNLRQTDVTSLAPLASLTTLETLDLRDTAVTDLAPLAELPLQRLRLQGSAVPEEQIAPLRRARPDLVVEAS